MTDKPISILDMTPVGIYRDGPVYKFSVGGFPSRGVKMVGEVHPTEQAALAQASALATIYQQADPFGNFAVVLGVAKVDGGFRGVINTYHSNS